VKSCFLEARAEGRAQLTRALGDRECGLSVGVGRRMRRGGGDGGGQADTASIAAPAPVQASGRGRMVPAALACAVPRLH
jgi:hypothetical protein